MTKRSKLALLIDFDGTVTESDMGVQLLEAFALEDWKHFEPMSEAGLIVGKECLASEFGCLPSDGEEELARFVQEKAVIRPGFGSWSGAARRTAFPSTLPPAGWASTYAPF